MKTIIAIMVVCLFIVGCSNSQEQIDAAIGDNEVPTQSAPVDSADIAAVEDELLEIDTLDEELDFSDLDALESDLNFG